MSGTNINLKCEQRGMPLIVALHRSLTLIV
jgi:hypothetical protein